MYTTQNVRILLQKYKVNFKIKNVFIKSFSREIHTDMKYVNRKLIKNSCSPNKIGILQKFYHTNNSPHPPPDPEETKRKKQQLLKGLSIGLIAFFVLEISRKIKEITDNADTEQPSNISWNEFVHTMLAKGEVKELLVMPERNLVLITLYHDSIIPGRIMGVKTYTMNISNVGQFEEKLREVENDLGIKPNESVPVVYRRNDTPMIFSTIFIIGIIYYLSRKLSVNVEGPLQGLFQLRKAKFTYIDPKIAGSGRGVKFSDVAGAHEAKQEIKELVGFLKNPQMYRKLGAKVPKGALLLGPPGCGKTLLAKAVATEGSVPFLSMNGSEFVEMIGGLGAARVRDLFEEAKEKAPSIIFIDEIDAIGRKRSVGISTIASNSEGDQTLNQLLVEMDGILSKEGVIVLASTNRLDILDKALLRPGRFDRHIVMDLPTLEERREIFEHHLSTITLENPVSHYSRRLASLTLGFSGADIASVCNEAAVYAGRYNKAVITMSDLEYAVERIIGGLEKKSNVLTQKERRVIAYHESGHALVGWLLEHTDVLLKVSILSRTNNTLGFSQYSPKDQKLYNEDEICEKMCMALGGRVAEAITFNKVTTGAQNDLERVTKMAYSQVRTMGFSKRVGHVSFPEEESREMGRRPYSKMLTATIDQEANRIIHDCYKNTEALLLANKDKLEILAEALLKKDALNYEDVVELLGPPLYKKNLVEEIPFENVSEPEKDIAT